MGRASGSQLTFEIPAAVFEAAGNTFRFRGLDTLGNEHEQIAADGPVGIAERASWLNNAGEFAAVAAPDIRAAITNVGQGVLDALEGGGQIGLDPWCLGERRLAISANGKARYTAMIEARVFCKRGRAGQHHSCDQKECRQSIGGTDYKTRGGTHDVQLTNAKQQTNWPQTTWRLGQCGQEALKGSE